MSIFIHKIGKYVTLLPKISIIDHLLNYFIQKEAIYRHCIP